MALTVMAFSGCISAEELKKGKTKAEEPNEQTKTETTEKIETVTINGQKTTTRTKTTTETSISEQKAKPDTSDGQSAAKNVTAGAKVDTGTIPESDKKSTEGLNLQGLKFGTGLAWSHNLGRRIVTQATLQNGVVRVDTENQDSARLMFESHWFFKPEANHPFCLGIRWLCISGTENLWGYGPFVAVQPGTTSNLISSVGAGLMVGFKTSEKSKTSWNLGIGATVEPSVKVLGDGIERNQPLPAGDTIRYKNTSVASLLVLFSVGFFSITD